MISATTLTQAYHSEWVGAIPRAMSFLRWTLLGGRGRERGGGECSHVRTHVPHMDNATDLLGNYVLKIERHKNRASTHLEKRW